MRLYYFEIMLEKWVFVLDEKLPTYYDAAIAIFRVASSPKSKKMSSTINSYACALIDIWKRSFDDQHVGSRISVVYKLEKLTTEYYNHVYVKLHRKSDTHKKTNVKKKLAVSSSQLNKQWRASRMGKSGKKTSIREIKYSCRV